MVTLLPHQEPAVQRLCAVKGRLVLNYSETGVGKGIMVYEQCRREGLKKIIYFAAGVLLQNKAVAEAERFGLRAKVIKTPKDYEDGLDVYVFSYASIRSKAGEVLRTLRDWADAVVMDECQAVSKRSSSQTRLLQEYLKLSSAKRIILMSATPIGKSAEDLPTQIFVGQDYGRGTALRRNLQWEQQRIGRKTIPKCVGWKDRDVVGRLLKPIMVRVTKEEAFGDSLPPMIHNTMRVSISGRKLHELVEDKVVTDDKEDLKRYAAADAVDKFFEDAEERRRRMQDWDGPPPDGEDNPFIMRVVQATLECCGVLKAPAIAEYADSLAESEKVVVFAHNYDVLDAVSAELDCEHLVCDGRLSDKELQYRYDRFVNGRDARVLVASYALSTGIDLVCSRRIIIAQPHWNPQIMMQAYNRIHRHGATGQCVTDHVIAMDGSEDGLARIEGIVLRNHARKREQADVGDLKGSLG